MRRPDLQSSIQKFFDEFVQAFRSFDGKTIAERYLAPYLAFHADRPAEVFLSRADTAAYFQRIVDEYHAKGCRSCRYDGLEVAPIGNECALATVTWELLAKDLTVLGTWRESYNLCFVQDRLLVFTSTDHAP